MKLMPGYRKIVPPGFWMLLFVFFQGTVLLAASTEDWIRRTGQAAAETARGNPQGVLYQVLPAVQTNLPTRTSVYANPGGAGIQQPLPVNLNSRLGSTGASYNAGTSYGFKQPPRVYQNVQAVAANRYLSNTTTFVPPSGKDK